MNSKDPVLEIFQNYKKTGAMHHAYLIESQDSAWTDSFLSLIAEYLMPTKGNQDFWHGSYESFGIDEGRMLKELQQNRPAVGEKKVFVVSAGSITREAQNSLLKMFEEPTEGTHFFVVIPSAETLLPTLRSRFMIVSARDDLRGMKKNEKNNEADFIKLSRSERLKFLAPMVEEGDRRKAVAFLDSLERAIAEKGDIKEKQFFLGELYAMKSYLHDRSSSVKMILEHLALIL